MNFVTNLFKLLYYNVYIYALTLYEHYRVERVVHNEKKYTAQEDDLHEWLP